MTNPFQLKYLDAIGIPVWVSRDLVQCSKPNIKHNSALNKGSGVSGNLDGKVSRGNVNVSSLLNDLDAQTRSKSHSNFQVKPQSQAKPKPIYHDPVEDIATPAAIVQATEIGRTSQHTIYACGDLSPDWLIIGESPDISTNGQGQPYAGDSGTLLRNMLKAVGIQDPRRQTYLVNILKSSMQSKSEEENIQLNSLLLKIIKQVTPKMILVVGQIAAQNLLKSNEPLVRLRGIKHTLPNSQIPLVVTYYPSYLLSKPTDKRKVWEDLKLAVEVKENSSLTI